MLDDLDQAELLELIEGELDPQQAQALRDRLARDPEALELVNFLRADRALLQSCRQPDLPRDFLTEIEPLVARPMLVGPAPGEFRRKYRRRGRRGRRKVWMSMAAAAAVMLVCSAGLWATLTYVFNSGPQDERLMAAADDARATPEATAPVASPNGATEALPTSGRMADPGTRIVHHHSPPSGEQPYPPGVAVASTSDPGSGTVEMQPSARVRREAADFALVVLVDDAREAEDVLVAGLADAAAGTSLVRNFSIEEAESLARQWRLAEARQGARRSRQDPLRADTGGEDGGQVDLPELERLARQAERQLRLMQEISEAAAEPILASGQLLGVPELVPSLRQQLDFSRRGAVLTITVPVADLAMLLEKLALMEGTQTALRMLPPATESDDARTAEPAPPVVRWPADAPAVQASLRKLQRAGEHTVVELPVIVEAASAR